jgi:hypothetical protein
MLCLIPLFGLLVVGVPILRIDASPAYTVRVTPKTFFSGDLKRLEAHLDFSSAICFEVKSDGLVRCVPDVEMWRNGKRIDKPKYGARLDSSSNEISLVLHESDNVDPRKYKYRITVGGMQWFERTFQEPIPSRRSEVGFGPISIEKPIELKSGNDSAVVWAMGGGDGLDLSKPETVSEQLRGLEWAIVLRLRVDKKNDKRPLRLR